MLLRGLVSLSAILQILLLDHAFFCSRISNDQGPRPQIAQQGHHVASHNGSTSSAPLPSLKARVAVHPTFLGNDWIVDHHDFTCLLPIGSAAADLLDFYEGVAAFAALTNVVPSRSHRICVGNIMLEAMAPAGHVIHWIAVQGFANWMIELTRRGYVSTYQINFIHRTTGLLLTFSLWVGYTRSMGDVPQ